MSNHNDASSSIKNTHQSFNKDQLLTHFEVPTLPFNALSLNEPDEKEEKKTDQFHQQIKQQQRQKAHNEIPIKPPLYYHQQNTQDMQYKYNHYYNNQNEKESMKTNRSTKMVPSELTTPKAPTMSVQEKKQHPQMVMQSNQDAASEYMTENAQSYGASQANGHYQTAHAQNMPVQPHLQTHEYGYEPGTLDYMRPGEPMQAHAGYVPQQLHQHQYNNFPQYFDDPRHSNYAFEQQQQQQFHGNSLPELSPELEAELLFMLKLDRQITALQRSGDVQNALELMESGLRSHLKVYGVEAEQTIAYAERLATALNRAAMACLNSEEFMQSLRLLRRAEKHCVHFPSLLDIRVQTLNNLACCYRRLKKPKTALNLLKESLVLLELENVFEGRSVTHLNLCAILSECGRHIDAVDHAKAAVLTCQKQLLAGDLHTQLLEARTDSERHSILEKITLLAIAYHNLGVEEEFMHSWQKCLEWYRKAYDLSKEFLGPDESLTRTFLDSFRAAHAHISHLSVAPSPSSSRMHRSSLSSHSVRPVHHRGLSSGRPSTAVRRHPVASNTSSP